MPNLILVRHGQSQWNLENRFTGWTDIDLSPKGAEEADAAGAAILKSGIMQQAEEERRKALEQLRNKL